MGTNQKSINRGWRDGSVVKAPATLIEEGISSQHLCEAAFMDGKICW